MHLPSSEWVFHRLIHTDTVSKTLTKENKLCPFCKDEVENEIHVMFDCPVYSEIRGKYGIMKTTNHDKQRAVVALLSSQDRDVIVKTSKFVFFAF